ncbi:MULTISPECIES: succinylglutamate desuccinylase/aspartoacylase family protein [Caballeronia]|uniref:Succinylglutamate desuccinylase n=1 Tax=Caballeronia zhejiangensis TaxID=871203 RepID=A0A656QRS5_9BURK|nr:MULTISPECIES: succinylglutamate desuccinylase/aspartoacylase family protein [Caballeronia]EKS70905.1 succinylglutamate desuccinylase/aspartoacylase [Burkholderia sp. SJ98]KDR33936.1 succinylglutamate desuccinylase [Caballeronia zhejiangensis]MDR5788811.1 succinylglutamate desuccinylase/aspartoacylase family protein [Caballeronia sp. LP003]MDR5795171.1 succinylglutamate desuccinylase/aspartoacylase family protein [Caballeronia sp. LZ008]
MLLKRTPLLAATIGTQRDLVSLTFGPPDADMKVYLQASLHADETPAMLTAHVLRDELQALEAAGKLDATVTLVPIANPIGLSQHVFGQFFGCFELNSAANFNRGVARPSDICAHLEGRLGSDEDANRRAIKNAMRASLDACAPTTEFDALRSTLLKLSCDADIVLDIHCSLEAVVHVYADTAAWPRVEPLARHLQSRAQMLFDGADLGLFIDWTRLAWADVEARFGDRYPVGEGAVAAIVECAGERDVTYESARRHARAIVAYLVDRGAIRDTPSPCPALIHPATRQAASEHFYAATSGIVVYAANIGDVVEVGEAICDIVDPITGATTTLRSRTKGVFYMRRAIRFVTAGAEIGRVTGG